MIDVDHIEKIIREHGQSEADRRRLPDNDILELVAAYWEQLAHAEALAGALRGCVEAWGWTDRMDDFAKEQPTKEVLKKLEWVKDQFDQAQAILARLPTSALAERRALEGCRDAIPGLINASDELMTEFVSKKRAARWDIINDALCAGQKALAAYDAARRM